MLKSNTSFFKNNKLKLTGVVSAFLIFFLLLFFLYYEKETSSSGDNETLGRVEVEENSEKVSLSEPIEELQVQTTDHGNSDNNHPSSLADNNQGSQRVDSEGRRILSKAEYDELIANDEEFAMSVIIQKMENTKGSGSLYDDQILYSLLP